MRRSERVVPAEFVPDQDKFLREAIAPLHDQTSLQEALLALWMFWKESKTKEQFEAALLQGNGAVESLREKARQYVSKKVRGYWWSMRYGKEIPFSHLVPEDVEEAGDWMDFFGIVAPSPDSDEGRNSQEYWKRYWEIKAAAQKILARAQLDALFSKDGPKPYSYEQQWRLLELRASGWSLKRIADHFQIKSGEVSERLEEIKSLLQAKLPEALKPAPKPERKKLVFKELKADPDGDKTTRKIIMTPEMSKMKEKEFCEKYEVSKSTYYRAKAHGHFFKNYHHSIVQDVIDSFKTRRDETEEAGVGPAVAEVQREKMKETLKNTVVCERVEIDPADANQTARVLAEKYGLSRSQIYSAKQRAKSNGGRLYAFRNYCGLYEKAGQKAILKPNVRDGKIATLQEFRKSEELQEKVRSILLERDVSMYSLSEARLKEVVERQVKLLLNLAKGSPPKEASLSAGYGSWESRKNALNVLRKRLLGILYIPRNMREIQDDYILEQLADGASVKEVAQEVFRPKRKPEKGFTARDLEHFRYGRLRRIQKQKGL